MMKKLPSFKGLKMRIPIIIPIKGRRIINQGSGVRGREGCRSLPARV